MTNEKIVTAKNGYIALAIMIGLIIITAGGMALFKHPLWLAIIPFIILIIPGFFVVNPNSSQVLVLFGDYKGTVKDNGFFWANPFIENKKFHYVLETLIAKG